jgi:hypothetical protein
MITNQSTKQAANTCLLYCDVIGGSIKDGFFISTQKFIKLQWNSINNSLNTVR